MDIQYCSKVNEAKSRVIKNAIDKEMDLCEKCNNKCTKRRYISKKWCVLYIGSVDNTGKDYELIARLLDNAFKDNGETFDISDIGYIPFIATRGAKLNTNTAMCGHYNILRTIEEYTPKKIVIVGTKLMGLLEPLLYVNFNKNYNQILGTTILEFDHRCSVSVVRDTNFLFSKDGNQGEKINSYKKELYHSFKAMK